MEVRQHCQRKQGQLQEPRFAKSQDAITCVAQTAPIRPPPSPFWSRRYDGGGEAKSDAKSSFCQMFSGP
jgi:hypothetical protein